MWALTLLAADDPLNRAEIIYGAAGLIAALLAGIAAISLADRWRKRAAAAPAVDDTSVLTTYREMHEQGELTDAEYAELRRKLAEKAKVAPTAATSPAPTADAGGRPNLAKFVPPEVLAKRQPTAPPPDATEIDRPTPPAVLPEPPPPPGTS